MLEKISAQSRTTEVDTVTTQIIAAYQSTSLNSDSNLVSIVNLILPLSTSLNQSINRIKSDSKLEEEDELRDDAVRSFNYMVMGYTYNPDEGIKNAANQIMSIFNKYGLQMVNESYATETSLLNSLLADLAKPELKQHITLLPGVTESIAKIESTQNSFEASQLAYNQNKAQEGTYKNATTLKKQILQLINGKLIVYLRAMSIVNEATYGDFVRTVAQMIADNNENVKKRLKKITIES